MNSEKKFYKYKPKRKLPGYIVDEVLGSEYPDFHTKRRKYRKKFRMKENEINKEER